MLSKTKLRWQRRSEGSTNNYDLVLENPEDVDSERMHELLNRIEEEKHRGLKLSGRARTEFRRWFEEPDTPLRSRAYVLLSNWFLTDSGDKNSGVASRCEALWDELFACRPLDRLSSPAPGENHIVESYPFDRFWPRLVQAQKDEVEDSPSNGRVIVTEPVELSLKKTEETKTKSTVEMIRAVFEQGDLRVEVKGSPEAVAEFFRKVRD